MVMGYTASRMGRNPVGYQMPQQNTSQAAPVGLTGGFGFSGNLGATPGNGLAGVILVAAAGLAIFYVVTHKVQGTR